MRPIGFSTGAISRGDFRSALAHLAEYNVPVVELSALRLHELELLVLALPQLDLSNFESVCFHAPSRFASSDESRVIECLRTVAKLGLPSVVHPDVIRTPEEWACLGSMLWIENMDKRKPVGRTAGELSSWFAMFPQAGFCFDLGHARQVDPTMKEALLILERFGSRLREVHISEVNSNSRHDPLSMYAISAFRSVAHLIPEPVPVILETLIDCGQSDVVTEIARARLALEPMPLPVTG